MKTRNILLLAACILVPLMVGGISGFLTVQGVNGWYSTLQKPFFNPPNYVFGPVWTLLYTLMGVSLYLVLRSPSSSKRKALIVFSIQLVLNFFWSLIFFRWHALSLAFIEILALWICILVIIIVFLRISRPAGWLQIPYLLWVSFATLLTGALLYLNT